MRNSGKWKDVWIDYQMLIESIHQGRATYHRLNALKKLNKTIEDRMKQIKEEVKND
jgi:hypothetical protein